MAICAVEGCIDGSGCKELKGIHMWTEPLVEMGGHSSAWELEYGAQDCCCMSCTGQRDGRPTQETEQAACKLLCAMPGLGVVGAQGCVLNYSISMQKIYSSRNIRQSHKNPVRLPFS